MNVLSPSFKFWLWLISCHIFSGQQVWKDEFFFSVQHSYPPLRWQELSFLGESLLLQLQSKGLKWLPAVVLANQDHSHPTRPILGQWASALVGTFTESSWDKGELLLLSNKGGGTWTPGAHLCHHLSRAYLRMKQKWCHCFCSDWLIPFMAFSLTKHEATRITAIEHYQRSPW